MDNSIVLSSAVFIFSILSSGVCSAILLYVLYVQVQQFRLQSPLHGLKILLTIVVASLLLANFIIFVSSIVLYGKPISANIVSVLSVLNRFIGIFTTAALGLIYGYQARLEQE